MTLQGWRYHVVGRDPSLELMFDNAVAMWTSAKEADIIVFSGGTDISVTMYGEFIAHPQTQKPDKDRDAIERRIYTVGVLKRKVLVGICRGAQLLNVLNGGRLWQHVNNHQGPHPIFYKNETGEKKTFIVTSDHHQMMRPATHARILGWCNKASIRCTGTETNPITADADFDPEIVWYPMTRSLCYQPHPEWGLKSDRDLFMSCLKRVMIG